jgi:DNA repair exonuclease SbcCD nuclease subunit
MGAAGKIAERARMELPDLTIITGDLYDGASDPDSRELAKKLVVEQADIAPVVIIKGNHDIRTDLLILAGLRAKFPIHVYEQPSVMSFLGKQGDSVFIHFLPWLTKAAWVAGQVGVDMGIQAGNEAVSLLALTYLKMQVAKYGAGKHLLYSHLMISGSKAENHQPLLGEGITFGYHDLVEAGFSGGAFGHIHLAQTFGDREQGSPEFRYNGAIAALNYGESSQDKSFSILDTDTLGVTTFHLPTTKRITYDAEWNGGINFTEPFPSLEVRGARVRIRLLVAEGYNAEDGRKAIKQYFEPLPLLELKIEAQRKPMDQVRAATIAAAQTASQKLEAYWAATSTIPNEPMRSDMLRIASEVESECLLNP